MAMTVMPAGAVSTPNAAIWWRTAQVREASMIASYTSVMALRLSESLITPLIQDRPMRSISWRRMARMEVANSLMFEPKRSSAEPVCTSKASRVRACRLSSSPSQLIDSTDLLSASPRNRELDRMWHRRWAAEVESRRKPR